MDSQNKEIKKRESSLPQIKTSSQNDYETERVETPNPWYHHQKRKLLLRYKKHLLEKEYAQRMALDTNQKSNMKK